VTVTALQPGPTDTDFFHRAGMDNTEAGQKGKSESQPDDVARQGLEALFDGKGHVYAAATKTKMEGMLANAIPRRGEGRHAREDGQAQHGTLNSEQAQCRARAKNRDESSGKTGDDEMKEALREKPNAEMLPRIGGGSPFQDGQYMPPPQDKDGKQWIRTSVLVQAEPAELYAMWHQVEEAPLWQEQIESVVRAGPKTSRWTMRIDPWAETKAA
jgi:hypothetical protein